MQFPTSPNSPKVLFPYPSDGAIVACSPPHFAWFPVTGAEGYHIEVSNSQGEVIYQRDTGRIPVHVPDIIWSTGSYSWDIIAWNNSERVNRGLQSFTIAPDAASLPRPNLEELLARIPANHPRFLYTRDRVRAIAKTLATTRSQQWQKIQFIANEFLNAAAPSYPTFQHIADPTLRKMEYKQYFHQFRITVDRGLQYLALAYLVTEDEKYLLPAKNILLELASWPVGSEDVSSVYPKYNGDEIGLSIARTLHRAYDWLYHGLTDAEKAKVFSACQQRATQVFQYLQQRNYHQFPGRSHPGRLISYLLEMSLVLANATPEAVSWAGYALKALMSVHPHWGSDDGGWAQGIWYAKNYNVYSLPAIEALANICQLNLWERLFYRNFGYFLFYCTSPLAEMQPFGDGAERSVLGNCGGWLLNIMRFYAHKFCDRNLGWWAAQVIPHNEEIWELGLLYEDNLPQQIPNLPNARLFPEVGWAGLHSDLSRPEDDTFLLFKSSPYGSASHSHGDQNAFAIMKGGIPLAIPSGYYGPYYNSPHHREWTQSTKANNCILVNGKGQSIGDNTATGRIFAFENYPEMCYVAGDATPAYQGKLTRWERHILFLRSGLFILLDELAAPEPVTFQWMLHSLEKMSVDGNTIFSRRKGAELEVKLYATQSLTLSQTDLFKPTYNTDLPEAWHRSMPNHWHLSAATETPSRSLRIVAVMAVRCDREKLDIDVREEKGWIRAIAQNSLTNVKGAAQLIENTPIPDTIDPHPQESLLRLYGQSLSSNFTLKIP
ncbi:DUF4962 domain-containing protein [Roseofilum casamattae]|uniref:DUF4962 domain-containing protein n=1 Tax=Roseofilum casamattae BLCC-M143 TaxID=3022442 RepID=A0ABT7BWP5_9CYAN|nr:DUF4962 domain-containing protein [Roseofilum casamattae]MDJ1182693.1 DUF4962 domain-containing protein [Roseofilum casamattae BLCC-M143]